MNIWLRAGLTRYLGRRLRISRELNNPDLLGLAVFRPYVFGPAVRPAKRWRRSLSTESGRGSSSRARRAGAHKGSPPEIPLPTTHDDPRAWIPYLEPYIPESLRQEPQCEWRPGASEKQQCRTIIHILYTARQKRRIDLLSFLGIQMKRWDAVHAIMQRLLNMVEDSDSSPGRSHLPSNLNWGAVGSFKQITGKELAKLGAVPVKRNKRTLSLDTFDTYSEEPKISNRMGEFPPRLCIMEEIWQSLGSIVLDAADLPAGESRTAMSHVYQILARLHHIDFIPNEVYKYVPNQGHSLRRSPAIHILSSHIMNVLSDAVWQSTEDEMATKAAAAGSEVTPPRFKMRVRSLGHGIWLDFILWCCAEGGFSKEGAWILERVQERSGDKAWSVKSWDSLDLDPKEVHPSSVDRDHVWGESVKFPHKESPESLEPFQGLGERTISSEVVSSLMEGLINAINVGVGHRGKSPAYVQYYITVLRSILDRNGLSPTPSYLFRLIVRMFESGGLVPESDPAAFEHLLKLAPPMNPDQLMNKPSFSTDLGLEPPSIEAISNGSATALGLYRYILDLYSYTGNVGGALNLFEKFLASLDAAKEQNIRQFARELVDTLEEKSTTETCEQSLTLESPPPRFDPPHLPNSSLALLLDISTSSKAYTFGEWLLRSTDVDGPVIPPSSYGDKAIASAIIRFATATKSEDLLSSVTKCLTVPLPNNVLKAILNYKISLNDWDNVARIFSHLRDEKNGHWGVSNVTFLAAAIIKLDRQPKSDLQQHSLGTAKGILIQLLEGKYNRKQDPAGPPYSYQEEVLYQLHRLLGSVPGPLSDACRKTKVRWKPTGREMVRNISVVAFRYLLSAVVENHGSAQGQRLWNLWCFDPETPKTQRLQPGGTSLLYFSPELAWVDRTVPIHNGKNWKDQRTKAVIPDLRTIRIIAQGAVLEYRKCLIEKDHQPTGSHKSRSHTTLEETEEMLEWCLGVFRKFRLQDTQIDVELEGYVTRRKEKSWKTFKPTHPEATTTARSTKDGTHSVIE